MRAPFSVRLLFPLLAACAPDPLPAPLSATPPQSPGAIVAPIPAALAPPVAMRTPHETHIHGLTLTDEYFWLRNKGTPDVLAYLAAENAYADAMAKPFEPLAESLYEEMVARVQQDDASPPYREGDFLYYSRLEKGKQYPIHCRKRAHVGVGVGGEEILLDLNVLAASEKFIPVPRRVVSDDAKELAYLLDTAGFRQFTLNVKNLVTGQIGAETIPRVDAVDFARDNRTLFYVTEDAQTKRPNKLFRHVLGEDPAKDVLVYEEPDEMFDLDLERTLDGAFLVATSESKTTSEVRVIDAKKPLVAPVLVASREHDHKYFVTHRGDRFYIRTNSGGRNFRLVTAKVSDPRRESWKELLPHRADVMIDGDLAFDDHMVLLERSDALPKLVLLDYATAKETLIEQSETAYSVRPEENHEFKAKTFRYTYQTLRTPATVVEYDLPTKARTLLKETKT